MEQWPRGVTSLQAPGSGRVQDTTRNPTLPGSGSLRTAKVGGQQSGGWLPGGWVGAGEPSANGMF